MPTPTPPPLPPDWPFSARTDSRELIFFEDAKLPGFDGKWRLYCTMPIPDINDPAEMDGVYGRGGLVQAGDYMLRPYRRGGFVRHLNKKTYLTANRFRNEYYIHAALWDAGFPTVEPVGFACRRLCWGVEGIYITKRADGLPWPRVWSGTDNKNQAAHAAWLIKALVSWGLWAPDLNAANFIAAGDGRLLALDWDKAKWSSKPCLAERYRARIERSMFKLGAPTDLIDALRNALNAPFNHK